MLTESHVMKSDQQLNDYYFKIGYKLSSL